MALFTLNDAAALRQNILSTVDEQARTIAEDLVRHSKSKEEVLENIKVWIRNYPDKNTFNVCVLHDIMVSTLEWKRIGSEKIVPILQTLLEDKYREAFPDFPIEKDPERDCVFYLRVTFHSV